MGRLARAITSLTTQKETIMALSDYEVRDYEAVILADAKGDPIIGDDGKHIVVEIYGPGSIFYAQAEAKSNSAAIDKLRKKGKTETSPEQSLIETAEYLATCTRSITDNAKSWFPGREGKDLLMAMYTHRPIGYIRDQLSAVLKDWANFIKPSTTN
jgi:hypothetical protein